MHRYLGWSDTSLPRLAVSSSAHLGWAEVSSYLGWTEATLHYIGPARAVDIRPRKHPRWFAPGRDPLLIRAGAGSLVLHTDLDHGIDH